MPRPLRAVLFGDRALLGPDKGPPPSPEERAWWREASKPDRRRTFLLWIPWFSGLFILPNLLRHPATFFAGRWMIIIPTGLAAGVVAGVLNWLATSRGLFRQRLSGKRVRDALLASVDGGEAPPAP
jgi:hypothetical protein